MKACPNCQSTYEDWIEFCFNDGVPLVAQEPKPAPALPKPAPPPQAAPAGSAFDAPEARLVSGSDLPEPANLSRFSAANSLDAPDPSLRFGRAPLKSPTPEVAPEPVELAAPTPLAAPLADAVADQPEPDPFSEEETFIAMPPPPAPPITRVAAEPTLIPEADTGAPPVAASAAGSLDLDAMSDIASALQAPVAAPSAPVRPYHAPPREESEDAKATIPMYAAQPEDPRGRSALDDEPARKKGGGAGIGVALIALMAFGALAVVALAGTWWTMSRGGNDPTPVATAPVVTAPAVLRAAAPPPAPVEVAVAPPPVEPPPVEPTPAVPVAVAPPVAAPVAVATRPTTTTAATTATTTRPTTTTTGAAANSAATTPATRPATTAATTAPATSAVTSDSVWGGTPTAPSSGFLKIVSDPEGGTVYVNDVARGKTPVTVELSYGAHQVKVMRPGYKTEIRDVNIRIRELTVPFALKPEVVTGQVNVYGPDGYRVVVDGHDMGPMPVTVQVSEGVRQFKLVAPDGTSCNLPKEIKFKPAGRPETITLACP
jgi:hypothetical protein